MIQIVNLVMNLKKHKVIYLSKIYLNYDKKKEDIETIIFFFLILIKTDHKKKYKILIFLHFIMNLSNQENSK